MRSGTRYTEKYLGSSLFLDTARMTRWHWHGASENKAIRNRRHLQTSFEQIFSELFLLRHLLIFKRSALQYRKPLCLPCVISQLNSPSSLSCSGYHVWETLSWDQDLGEVHLVLFSTSPPPEHLCTLTERFQVVTYSLQASSVMGINSPTNIP